MIGVNNYITIKSGYKKVSELTLDDILYDPVKQVESGIKELSAPRMSSFYRIIVPKLHPIECTSDVMVLTDVGLLKPQDLCPRCRVHSPFGFLPVLRSIPISEQTQVVDIIPRSKDFFVLVNGIYILVGDR